MLKKLWNVRLLLIVCATFLAAFTGSPEGAVLAIPEGMRMEIQQQ